MYMHITIINDCRDDNATGRQMTRMGSLVPEASLSFVGVHNDIEAAGNLVDILDAYEDRKGGILVNVAPRHGQAKKWPNGTPFGYFTYKNITVVTSVDGHTLSLVKKLGLADTVRVMDIPTVLADMRSKGFLDEVLETWITNTQFRSFDFTPRALAWLLSGHALPHTEQALSTIANMPDTVWCIDNFGNCKTTLLESEAESHPTSIARFSRLKDVPNDTPALIAGSSGLPGKRFLELVVQGGSAAKHFSLTTGSPLPL